MKSPIHDASARQHSGEPFSGLSANDARRDRLRNQDLAAVDGEIEAYIKNGRPNCPAGGTYTFNAVDTPPACSLSAAPNLHTL